MERILRLQLYRYYGGVGSDRPLMAAKAFPRVPSQKTDFNRRKGVCTMNCVVSVYFERHLATTTKKKRGWEGGSGEEGGDRRWECAITVLIW